MRRERDVRHLFFRDELLQTRAGLVTHRAAIDAQGRTTLDVLAAAPDVKLTALMTPEHGFEAKSEGRIADSFDSTRALPVYSLYGATLGPTARMLAEVDVLVVDLVDVGTRYYTYMSTLYQTLLAAAIRNAKEPPPALDVPGVPPDLEGLVRRALQPDPARRPDAEEMQAVLSGIR